MDIWHSPENSLIFVIGENRIFYLYRPAMAASNSDGQRLAAYLSRFKSHSEFHEEVRRLGITHFLLHPAWIRVGPPGAMHPVESEFVIQIPQHTLDVLRDYLATYTVAVYQDKHYKLFQVRLPSRKT